MIENTEFFGAGFGDFDNESFVIAGVGQAADNFYENGFVVHPVGDFDNGSGWSCAM
ncbi:MAG: hypothetical protein IPG90_06425 [Bacteroidetes bacterium]|nr:hypothetical protein [Bacteroidota bacterium]